MLTKYCYCYKGKIVSAIHFSNYLFIWTIIIYINKIVSMKVVFIYILYFDLSCNTSTQSRISIHNVNIKYKDIQ